MLTFKTINDMPLNQSAIAANHVLHAVANGKSVGNILLFGENGSGKSTLARHLPIWFQAAHGHPDGTLYADIDVPTSLNAAQLQQICMPISMNPTGYDWIVLDEADKPSDKAAFDKLHGILEFNRQKLFILTANTIAVFPPGILSRCTTINVIAPTPQEYLPYAQKVLIQRGLKKSDDYVLSVLNTASIGGNDCRKYQRVIDLI
jgi:replication-associated recombination protein RarA